MKPSRSWCFAISLACIVTGATVCVFEHNGPYYQGKSLHSWLENYHNFPDGSRDCLEADAAIRHFGKQAIPLLTRWIACTDSPLQTKLCDLSKDLVPKKWQPYTANDRQGLAACGFLALGTNGAAAIPNLIAALDSAPDDSVFSTAFFAIGPQSIPALTNAMANSNLHRRFVAVCVVSYFPLQEPRMISRNLAGDNWLKNTSVDESVTSALLRTMQDEDPGVRAQAAWALRRYGMGSPAVISSLIAMLQDQSPDPRHCAVKSLGRLGAAAQSALPQLKIMLNDGDFPVRDSATNAIRMINETLRHQGGGDE